MTRHLVQIDGLLWQREGSKVLVSDYRAVLGKSLVLNRSELRAFSEFFWVQAERAAQALAEKESRIAPIIPFNPHA